MGVVAVSKSESPTKEKIWYGIDEYVHKYQVHYVTKKYSCHKSNRQQYFQAVVIDVMTDFFFFKQLLSVTNEHFPPVKFNRIPQLTTKI